MCLKGTSVCDHCTSLRQLSSQNLVTTMMLEECWSIPVYFQALVCFRRQWKPTTNKDDTSVGLWVLVNFILGVEAQMIFIDGGWVGLNFLVNCMSISHAKRSNSNATVYSLPTFCQGTGGVCWSSILGCQKILPVDILQPPLNWLPSCLKAVAFSVSSLSCNDGKTPT